MNFQRPPRVPALPWLNAVCALTIILIALQIHQLHRIENAIHQAYNPPDTPEFSGKRWRGKSAHWAVVDKKWRAMDPYQQAAAMALLEADRGRYSDAYNIVFSMVNRAKMDGKSLGASVSSKIYQPAWERNQYARLKRYVGTREHTRLTRIAFLRANCRIRDRVNGATHYLIHPRKMVRLSGGVRQVKLSSGVTVWRGASRKYYSWPGWTGYSPKTKVYQKQVFRDRSHSFLCPNGCVDACR